MKKRLLSLILIPMLLTACSTQSEETETTDTNIKAVSESMLSDFEACKNKEYVNLDLSDCGLHLIDFDECRSLTIEGTYVQTAIAATNEENLQKFKEYCEFFFGEYNPECALFRSLDMDVPDEIKVGGHTYIDWPKISDYYEQIKNESITIYFFMYRDIDNNKYFSWHINDTDFPHFINKGVAFSFLKDEGPNITSWLPPYIDSEKKVTSYINDGKSDDVTYQLLDGEVSIGEAISYFENDYLKDFPYEFEVENYSLSVSSVDVYKLDDDLYCYVLFFSPAWNNIPFNYGEERVTHNTAYSEYFAINEALMIKKDDIDAAVNLYFPSIISEDEPVESICSLESAVDIISDKLTKNVVFEVKSIELVYAGIEESYASAYVEPTWKMVAYNPNDDWYYDIYVNAVTEECRYSQYTPYY